MVAICFPGMNGPHYDAAMMDFCIMCRARMRRAKNQLQRGASAAGSQCSRELVERIMTNRFNGYVLKRAAEDDTLIN